jgi:peptidoglycan/LPS O-acetylase OafA/YrhL
LQCVWYQNHDEWFIYAFNDLRHFVLNLFSASYWGFQDGYSFNGPSWSISAEILVYVLFFGLSRVVPPGLVSAVAITIGISVLASVLRSAAGVKLAIFGAATFFYLGVVTMQLHALSEGQSERARMWWRVGCLAVSVSMAALVYLGRLKIAGASLAMFPAIILLFQLSVPDRFPSLNRGLTFLGDLTYASYMVQFPLQLFVVMAIESAGMAMNQIFPGHLFFLAYVLSVFGLARLVFLGFERPAQHALRRTFPVMVHGTS